MLHTRLAALALTTIAIAASGCGGSTKSSTQAAAPAQGAPAAQAELPGQSESTAQGKSLTRADLIAKANAICRRINAKLNATTVRSQQDYARLFPPVASLERAALAELSKLVPPASLAGDWQQVVASIQTLAGNTAKVAEDAKLSPGNFAKAERALVSANFNTRRPMLATAARAGFSDCAQVL